MADLVSLWQEQVRAAPRSGTLLRIRGYGSKDFIGPSSAGQTLDTREYRGIVHYDPRELVLTARCGTPLTEIEAVLAENEQMLACEPPHFGAAASFGGMIAAGLSGPRRPWAGAVRDFVLGCRLIDGHGHHLRFGGEVMKNVAGYDLSRLMCGSYGCLGVLTEASMKVLPIPQRRLSVRIAIDADEALRRLSRWASEPWPISGAAHDGTALIVRLEGGHGSVDASEARFGGEVVEDSFWQRLRDLQLPFFEGSVPLWRLSLPTDKKPPKLPGEMLIDWAGAQCWLRSEAPAEQIRATVSSVGGHAAQWRSTEGSPFHPLQPALLALHQRLKAQLDPHGLFNRGRLYAGL